MRLLFAAAFSRRAYRLGVIFIALAMVLLTISSQLEMFALGVLTRKGPTFFEVVAPVQDGKLQLSTEVSKEQLDQRWHQLDPSGSGVITEEGVQLFLQQWKGDNIFQRVVSYLNETIALDTNVLHLALFVAAIALFKAAALFFHRFTTKCLSIRISRDLRQNYFEHIQSLPMSFYFRFDIGSLASRVVGDAALIGEALNACLVNYFQTPFMVVTTLAVCFFVSWKLSLIIFLGLPLIAYPIVFLARRVKRLSKQIQQNQERFTSTLIDFLAGILTVKVFSMESFSLDKYREHNDKMAALEVRSAKYDLLTRPVVHTIAMLSLATVLLYGIYIQQMSVAELFFFCGMLYLFYEPIKKFAEENSHIQRGIAAAERLYEVMHLAPEIVDLPEATEINEFSKEIAFEDVWFRYNNEQEWVLKGLSFTVRKGEMVAIVGPTGAGKSTIVQLLPRLWEVGKGNIFVDGKAIGSYTQRSLRRLMAFVPQKPFLFLDSVARNITGGLPYTQQELESAAEKALADEFITRLPKGYDTILAEGGKNFSGGQQQRLAIARALFYKAPILIMDEATSALDAVSEEKIKAAIHQLRGEVTQIIIAHRLSTIEDADRIIYLDNGCKLAEGTKDELLVSCPPFMAMWQAMRLKGAG